MTCARGTTNRNDRGGSADRRARKLWLLATFGDGTTAPCSLRLSTNCQVSVTFDTISVDRYPLAGRDGGRYTRGNIRPACLPCQSVQGARMTNEGRRAS